MIFRKKRKRNKELIEIMLRNKIYTDSLSSRLAIENNLKSHPILNQMYDILAELYIHEKLDHTM